MHPDPVTSAAAGSDEPVPAVGTGSPPPRLTVAAVARRLGVAPATLRTWDRRYGIGPGEHEPGRHRRYSADDLARLELMQHALLRGASPADAAHYARATRLPQSDLGPTRRPDPVAPVQGEPAGPSPPPVENGDGEVASRIQVGGRVLRLPGADPAARGLGRAALAMDPAKIRRLLREAIDARGVEHAWDEVARPVLASVGRRWFDTGTGVEVEHLVSHCVVAVFGMRATAAPQGLNPRPVLLAGMPGEEHNLPLTVLAAALADRRVECRFLGSNLPAVALVAAVRRTAPAAVVLWAQVRDTADVELLDGLPRTRPRFRIYAAGPGWADVVVPPHVVRLDSLGEADRELTSAVLL